MITNTKEERMRIAISTINSEQTMLMQACKLSLNNDQTIEAVKIPNMNFRLQTQIIPNQWQDLQGEWANQDTYGVTAQILLGADQAILFPHAVRNPTKKLIQAHQARLKHREITSNYILFGSGGRQLKHTESKTRGTINNYLLDPESGKNSETCDFRSPRF